MSIYMRVGWGAEEGQRSLTIPPDLHEPKREVVVCICA